MMTDTVYSEMIRLSDKCKELSARVQELEELLGQLPTSPEIINKIKADGIEEMLDTIVYEANSTIMSYIDDCYEYIAKLRESDDVNN